MIYQKRADQLFAEAEWTDLRETDKSQYFAITDINNHSKPSLFFNEYLWEAKRSSIFHPREIARRRKACFRLRMSRILFAAKQLDDIAHGPTIICRSRGGLSANEKKEQFASNDDESYFLFFQSDNP